MKMLVRLHCPDIELGGRRPDIENARPTSLSGQPRCRVEIRRDEGAKMTQNGIGPIGHWTQKSFREGGHGDLTFLIVTQFGDDGARGAVAVAHGG